MPTASEFLAMARADTEAGMASNVPYSICFHAQQAGEKYLKALLVSRGARVPSTHGISARIDTCIEFDPEFNLLRPVAEDLTLFGVEIRYAPSKDEADRRCPRAWSAMRKICDVVSSKLVKRIAGVERRRRGLVDNDLIGKIREVGEPIRARGATRLYVFGSRARESHRPESDLDVLVDYDSESDFSIVELAGIKRVLEDALNLNVHITTRDGLSPRFRDEVEKQAVRVL